MRLRSRILPSAPAVRRATRRTAAVTALLLAGALGLPAGPLTPRADAAAAAAAPAPAGAGFTLNAGDLRFILEQIKIAERHAATATPANPCGTLLGGGPHQVPAPQLPYGLRTVDGSCNNLEPGQAAFGAAQRPMPRLAAPVFRGAEDADVPGLGPVGPPGPTSYAQRSGAVVDSRPRLISNLVADQTAANPAAVLAAGVPHRGFGSGPTAVPCTAPGVPVGCIPDGQTLPIPNVSTDAGLSPPFNSWFTLFGQFFDHGLDSTAKGGNGTVFVPIRPGDPLYDPDSQTNFMVLTRARDLPGADGVLGTADDRQDATNTDSPWVDQSQTYASHASHQVFLRAYADDAAGHPASTGKLLTGAGGGLATWASLKAQAADLLGIRLVDRDVAAVPLLATDPYGRFLPGPHGLPQIVTTGGGLVEGDTVAPVPVPADARHAGVAFLDDIAHHAVPAAGLVPDSDLAASSDFAHQPPGTYDDEMLDRHYVAGDGRINENIGLTAVHHVFHAEHNRLVDDIEHLITAQQVDVAQWHRPDGGWNGERVFQAARFVNEMEYQHLVFEEFARKVQPALDPFSTIQTDVDPAIDAEFAHAVYRFGHSMLTDTIARVGPTGSVEDLPLLDGFLDPLAYVDGGAAGRLTPDQAAGSIVRGMTDQTGNEIDEFVTQTLRNNLLGLPLDLAAINLTRGRDAGVPSLNRFRRQVFATTHDAALKPYASWSELGLALKHPYSLVNFMAAYGTHPSITAATTPAAKRAAARLIYDDDPARAPGTPADARAFLDGTGAWATPPAGLTSTGLDDVDLWIGGLAESLSPFGGMLGSTFDYVFEQQLTKLQNGDRLYYLARTAGLNLRSQIEGNSFAEMIMRNTDVRGLKADVFGTADCEFDLARLGTSGPIPDDPASACVEPDRLLRMPDGTIRYRTSNAVDPPGRNPQSTYDGTAHDDRIWGGLDNDTFWGNEGRDRIEGDAGNDTVLGGDGDDAISDSAGADVLKGGPGNDSVDAGPGLDTVVGGAGSDFVLAGVNTDIVFGGEDNDLIETDSGTDTVIGDGGDDWEEGGSQADDLVGDSGAPFFDDLNQPGNDVLAGQGGDDALEAEGGDDVVLSGPGVDRTAGLRGFDWVSAVGDPAPADADLGRLLVPLPPPTTALQDRYADVEALSGWRFDDVLRGDDVVPSTSGTPVGSNVLTAAGIDRIGGLRALLPPGTTSYGAGNILLGGAGSDTLEGRGGDDVIDGDAWLDVRLSVRTDPLDPTTEVRSARTVAELQQEVLAGTLDPADVVIVREVRADPGPGDLDTAVFAGSVADHTITTSGGVTTVVDHAPAPPPGAGGEAAAGTGTDTLTHVERLVFADAVQLPTPVVLQASAGNRTATVTWPDTPGGPPARTEVRLTDQQTGAVSLFLPAAGALSLSLSGLANGHPYQFQVRVFDASDIVLWAVRSDVVTPATVPAAPTIGAGLRRDTAAVVRWTAPADDGGMPITRYAVRVVDASGAQVGPIRTTTGPVTQLLVTGLVNGRAYRAQVAAENARGQGPYSAPSAPVTPATLPAAPRILPAVGGASGGVLTTATARWAAPSATGGSPITGYVVTALRMSSPSPTARVLGRTRSPLLPAAMRSRTFTLAAGVYRFEVAARNAVGTGPASARSNAVQAQ